MAPLIPEPASMPKRDVAKVTVIVEMDNGVTKTIEFDGRTVDLEATTAFNSGEPDDIRPFAGPTTYEFWPSYRSRVDCLVKATARSTPRAIPGLPEAPDPGRLVLVKVWPVVGMLVLLPRSSVLGQLSEEITGEPGTVLSISDGGWAMVDRGRWGQFGVPVRELRRYEPEPMPAAGAGVGGVECGGC